MTSEVPRLRFQASLQPKLERTPRKASRRCRTGKRPCPGHSQDKDPDKFRCQKVA